VTTQPAETESAETASEAPLDAPDRHHPIGRLAVHAERLTLRASRGPVYGPVDLDVPEGWLVAVVGAQGEGRTSLLLTIAGRMRPTSGSLDVLGHHLPSGRARVQSHCALANFTGIDTLDDALTVGELIRERADLSVPLWRRPIAIGDDAMNDLMDLVYDGQAPDPATVVWHLTPLQVAQTRLLLALIGGPRLIVVDDADVVRDPAEQARLWSTLQRICSTGVTIVAASTSRAAIPGDVRAVDLHSDRQTLETHPTHQTEVA
jgi:ABC-type multidrug transport system ATPase subunit